MKSIRQELTTRLLVGTSLLLITAGVVLSVMLHSELLDSFDANLMTKARMIQALTMREGDLIESEIHDDTMPEYREEEDPEFFQITFQDGTIINRSESMEDFPAKVPTLSDETEAIGNIRLEDGEPGRYALIRVLPINEVDVDEEEEIEEDEIIFKIPDNVDPETATITIFVAKSKKDFDQLLDLIYLTIGGIILLVLAGIFILVRSTIVKGMNPIEAINAQIACIDPNEPEKRVVLEEIPSELNTIANALNELLDRMNQVITRERRFTSDVAHELRTPVSELRTACEVGSMAPEDTEATVLFFEDINDIALQMENVVNNLIALSRWDQEQATTTTEEIKLEPLVKKCWEHFSPEAKNNQIDLDCRIDPDTTLSTDREKLEMIVKNLLDNAIAYSVPGSRIRCRIEPGNPSINLVFENQAASLCQEDIKYMFDRFWRKESARSEVNHSGLGLSIVKALADILKIELHPELLEDRWFRMNLKIRI